MNFRTVLRRLFEPDYMEEYDCKGEEWITKEDVEEGSELFKQEMEIQIGEMSTLISRNYDKWMKEFEEKRGR